MADESQVHIHIKTTADAKAAEQVADAVEKTTEAGKGAEGAMDAAAGAAEGATEALQSTAKSATDTAAELKKTGDQAEAAIEKSGDALDEAFASARKAVKEARDSLREAVDEAEEEGGKTGSRFKGGVEGKTKDIVWTQDTLTAATKAWELGTIIGTELSKAVNWYAEQGTLNGFMDAWLEGWASKFGFATEAWEVNIKRAIEAANVSLAENKERHAEWLEEYSKAPSQDAITWLDNLKQKAVDSQTALKDLKAVQDALQRAEMDAIGQDEADAIDTIDADPVMTDAMKVKARQQARNEAEKRRLEKRLEQRAEQRAESADNVLGSQSDVTTKKAIEAAQLERAKVWSEMKGVAEAAAGGNKELAARQFDLQAKDRGITDMSLGENEEAKAELAQKARQQAEAAAAEAVRKDAALRARLAVEDQSDISTTSRTAERGTGQAERQAKALQAKEDEQRRREEEKAAADEAKRLQAIDQESGNAEITNVAGQLDGLIGETKNADFKAKLEELRATLTDKDGASLADVQAIQGFLSEIKTSDAAAKQMMASLARSMAESQRLLLGELKALHVDFESFKSQQRN